MNHYIYISPSQLNVFEQCSLKWFFRSKAKINTRPSSYLVVGSAVHAGIAADYETVKETGSLAPLDIIEDITAEAFMFLVKDALLTKTENTSTLKDDSLALVRLHHQKIAPRVQPKDVEVWLNVVLSRPAGTPIMIRQRSDVVTVDGRVIDNKTSGKRINEKLGAEVDGQLTSYALGYQQKYGAIPKRVELHRLIRQKVLDHQIIAAPRSQEDIDRYLRKVSRIADRMEANDVYPIDDVKVCGFCEYRPICWGHRWHEYLKNPQLAKDRAEKLMADVIIQKPTFIETEKTEE